MFTPESVRVPAPDLVNVPLPVPMIPEIAVLPAPPTEKLVLLPLTAPRVSSVPLFAVNTPPLALNVVAPNVIPAVPELTLASLPIVKVCAPMDKLPRLCVSPAPSDRRPELICTAPDTVVGRLKFSPLSPAKDKVPPESAKLPDPRALGLVVARRVPALRLVVPL